MKMLKYSIDGGDGTEMPMFSWFLESKTLACVADSNFVYALEMATCSIVQMFNLQTETWGETVQLASSVPARNRDCLGMVSAGGEGVFVYWGRSERGAFRLYLHHVLTNETSSSSQRLDQYPLKMGAVHEAYFS